MVALHAGVAERLGNGLQSRLHGFESRHSLHEQLGVRSHEELLSGRSLDVCVERIGAQHAGQ
jgi:hypothetical protein